MMSRLQNCEPRKCRPKSFGEVHDNYNWIECASVKNPDKNYFFNVRSHCRTWTRPVPENVDLPFFNSRPVAPRASDNENETSPPVSELDDASSGDNKETEEIENSNEDEQRFFEISSKLFYHGARNSRHSRRPRRKILEDIPEEDSEFGETIPVVDFLEVQYLSEDSAKRLRSPSSSSSESSRESSIESTKESSSSCHCSCCDLPKEDSDDAARSYESSTSYQSLSSTFAAPRLKEITYFDLMTEPRNKCRRRKKCKIEPSKDEKKLRLTPEKRICEMHGIRTISYDPIYEFINPILSPDIQPSRLTDCSSSVSPVPNSPIRRFDDFPLHIRNPILSEVSSGSENMEPIQKFDEYCNEVSASKIIGDKKKSFEDILGGKVLRIKLWRIDLDKDYLLRKNKKDNINKKEISKTAKEETGEDSEVEKSEENSGKYNFKKNSDSDQEKWSDSEVIRRYPTRLRSSRNYKRNTKMYFESDTETEDFGFVRKHFRPLRNRKEKTQKGKRSFKALSETEYSRIEEKNNDIDVEADENSKREDSETEYSEREDESDEHSKDNSDRHLVDEEENSSVGWVIVNSQINKMTLKKVVNSGSPLNEKINVSKADIEEKGIIDMSETKQKSEADIVPDKEMEDLRIDFERKEDKIISFEGKDLEVRPKIEDLKLRENIEMRANPREFINSSSSNQRELTLLENLQILKSAFSLVQTYSQDIDDKMEEVSQSQTKSQEIKSQEDELQNGEQLIDVDEEEEILLFQEDKQKESQEKRKANRELANKAPENKAADQKIEDLRVDSEWKEGKIRSFVINDPERPPEIVQDLLLAENIETKSNSFEFLNSCRLTARELTLNEDVEHLKSSVSSFQTDFEELKDKIEVLNKSQTMSQEIKSQKYEFQKEEKPIDVDEEELILLEGDIIVDDQLMDLEEEEILLMGEDLFEGDNSMNLDDSSEKEKRLTLPVIGNKDKRSVEELLEIKNRKDERNEELVITENRNELKVLPIERDNKERELMSVEKESMQRELTEIEKEKGKIVEAKSINLDEDRSSETEANSALLECRSTEGKNDEDATDVDDGGILSEKEKDENREEKLIDSGNRNDKSKSPKVEKELNQSDKRSEEVLEIQKRNGRIEELVVIDNRDEQGFLIIEGEDEEEELIIIGKGNKERDFSGNEKEKDTNVLEKLMNVPEGGSSETESCSTQMGESQVFSDTETIMGDYDLKRALAADESGDSDKTQVMSDSESD